MAHLDRRSFLTSLAAAPILAGAAGSALAAEGGKRYRACIIGDTEHGGYGHDVHRVWGVRDDVDVVGLADPDEAGRTKHGQEANAQNLYADWREMLEKEKPDLVAVAPRWTINHKEYLLACAEIGAHGFMEKPLCVDLAEADEMISAIEAKNLKWSIAFNFRVTDIIQHLKKAIYEDKLIGSPLEIRGRGKEDNRAGGEDLIVLGCHVFDIMIWLLGMPTWCSADITWNGNPATPSDVMEATEPLGPIVGNRLQATYGFAKGIPGYFASMKSRDVSGSRWGLDICGAEGVISVRMDVIPEVLMLRDPSWTGANGAQWEPLPGAPEQVMENEHLERYAPIIHDLIASIEEDRLPAVSLQDGRNALEMTQGVFEAYTAGKTVELPLKERSHPLTRWS
ncbi:MAG: hypothetical protein AMXMBFR82_45940 [Candidatus Hydrogenedentota bacterium]